jgi:hypothetical protein
LPPILINRTPLAPPRAIAQASFQVSVVSDHLPLQLIELVR